MLLNRPEFHLVDTAVLHLGAVPFSVYNTSTPEQVAAPVPQRRQPRGGDRAPLPRTVTRARPRRRSSRSSSSTAPTTTSSASPSSRATGLSSFRFAETWQAVGPDDLAAIIYTSGTTGAAEGRRAHPRQRDGRVRRLRRALPAAARRPRDVLPPGAHVVDRWSSHWWASLTHGFTVTSVGRHAHGDLPAAERAADAWGARAADLGEAPAGARRPGRSATRRRSPRRSAAALRARLGLDARRAPRRRRGADADRRAALLRGARAADRRGVGDVGDRRRRRPATRRARSAPAPAARRCRASSSSSPTTASCSSAARW